ncbi:Lhr family helicase [Nannocystis bainbridge]|uniref:DEAD/DEAH box helicase n=1 Tax=Nannocystis bainbridge TaxID=2995303 RepID=A0ABT5E2R8_9BACT|nr:DEAD/DEAH box helicase [Nannocystis bainbridge]MDC0719042.1 DEAD/DEAH box helicase [Nannocystis bainbridge]
MTGDPLAFLHPAARAWFEACFDAPTSAQVAGWPAIEAGASTLLLAPTGSGKTLAAFLGAINRVMFAPVPAPAERCRVIYVSPIKALGVDVEQNLRSPLAGIAATAARLNMTVHTPTVAIRSGDTPQKARAYMQRHPPDILITTPESLYMLLTSESRAMLRSVDTVIVDEIHSLVASKRGTHLALSLERLEWLRAGARPLQRIGLSATQRPLTEVARFLGGSLVDGDAVSSRPVTIIDAGQVKPLELRIELPVAAAAAETAPAPTEEVPPAANEGPTAISGVQREAWPGLHARLVALIRAHRSTMLFVNSRRLAERLAAALNELAGQPLALAHHGSMAKDVRAGVEEQLKRGTLPAIVATSSLELGIDMGAVDLVIQLASPPSIAAGMQRVGRANHHVGGRSRGVIIPKFRGDLLPCAAAAQAMLAGAVESSRYPRNPLDILAQQVVATVAMDDWAAEDLYDKLRAAAPYSELPRDAFEGVLDMLSGRYPSEDFAYLRPRVNYDRVTGQLTARHGARRVAIGNAGSIPDRGLFGVFLAGNAATSRRVGELDEEMVFESRIGDVFVLGASSWRIEEITHDRVLVSPAPGEPGKLPFWRGDGPGRPLEFGQAIGALVRELGALPDAEAATKLAEQHCLDQPAADSLLQYVREEQEAAKALPTDRTIVVERFRDEIGDWRVCILSPFGAAVHAPWAMAVRGILLERYATELDVVWSDDGIVFRLPEAEHVPDPSQFFPRADEVEDRVVARLAETSLFATRFRENAGRALLLVKRRPGQRTPLWAMRRKSADLLAAASRFRDFPVVLETYRECLQDVFDLPGCVDVLRRVEQRAIKIVDVETRSPSPFAAALLFTYVGNFMYEGDAPLAERRAQALTIDHARLKALLGEAALRDLLDADAIAELEATLQRRARKLNHLDEVHDLLLALGDQDRDDVVARAGVGEEEVDRWLAELTHTRRIVRVKLGGRWRYIAAEDAGRYRDALGVVSPPGLPAVFLAAVEDPLADLVARHARTHGPFRAEWLAQRFAIGTALVVGALRRLAARGKVVEGEFIPGGAGLEWCDDEVLRRLKRMSLARLREEVEPVEQAVLGRFLLAWQGIGGEREGPEAVLQTIEQLQGVPVPASVLEGEVLPARVANYRATDLDVLCGAGDVVWRGVRPLGQADGYVALYLADDAALLAPDPTPAEGALAGRVREALQARGASFFAELATLVQAPADELLEALWDLVWAGEVTNDTLTCLRSRLAGGDRGPRPLRFGVDGRGRRSGPPGSEGRWSLIGPRPAEETDRRAARARQLLARHGVLTREAVAAEDMEGGFAAVYPVLKAMEEAGRVRRGYFVAGLGAVQFALPGAEDRLRDVRETDEDAPLTVLIAATDPANPYGAALPWPDVPEARFERAAGARVVLRDGRLVGFLGRGGRNLVTHLPDAEPERGRAVAALAEALALLPEVTGQRYVLLEQIDGQVAPASPLATALTAAGFRPTHDSLLLRRDEPRLGARRR